MEERNVFVWFLIKKYFFFLVKAVQKWNERKVKKNLVEERLTGAQIEVT
jgi:hypothetical protein